MPKDEGVARLSSAWSHALVVASCEVGTHDNDVELTNDQRNMQEPRSWEDGVQNCRGNVCGGLLLASRPCFSVYIDCGLPSLTAFGTLPFVPHGVSHSIFPSVYSNG